MGDLNSREIAILIWFAVGLFLFIWKGKGWGAIKGVGRTFFKPIILRSIALMATYVAGCVWVLHQIDLWRLDNLKTTVVWFATFVIGWLFDFDRWFANPNTKVRATLREVLNATVFVTFLTDTYTLSLPAELVLVPVLVFAGLMVAVSERTPKSVTVTKLFQGLLVFIGLGLLAFAVGQVLADVSGFATAENGREFAVPGLLSLMFLPFMYAFNVAAAYEVSFMSLPRRLEGAGLKPYAFRSALRAFGLNVSLLRRWKAALYALEPTSRVEIDNSLQVLRAAAARERRPPTVDPADGWSPHVARTWLKAHQLSAGDYNPRYGEWGATSPYRKLTGGILGDTLTFSIRGTAFAATRFTLSLNRSDETAPASLEAFIAAGETLLVTLFGEASSKAIRQLRAKRFKTRVGHAEVSVRTEGRVHSLVLQHDAHVEPFATPDPE